MKLKRVVTIFSAILLISVASFAAGRSDLADAVMKGDKAASGRSFSRRSTSMRRKPMARRHCIGPCIAKIWKPRTC